MTHLLLAGLLALAAAPESAPSLDPPSIVGGSATASFAVPEVPGAADADPVAAAIEAMPLRQRVAQLMAVTMAGSSTPSVEDLAYLKAYTPGAAIISRILKPSYAAVYVEKLRGVEQLNGVPLWIGANIYRLTTAERQELNEFVQLPSPLTLAAANDPATTAALSELLALHLGTMGFNLHLGPSLELAPVLDSAVGSVYNFGSDPAFIGETFQITRRAFDEYGIIAVPLGFPGGGANREARSAAVLLTPANQLHGQDLAPYRQAIADGAPIVHVGNTLVPTLDTSGAPACVSRVVIGDILRTELGYQGIVLAGPMDSQDVAGLIDPAEAAIRALEYGADMILWGGADSREMRAVDRIVAAVLEERLSEATINTALARVLTYKFAHRGEGKDKKSPHRAPLERKTQLARQVAAIEQRSITVVKNDGNVLPLRKDKSMPVGITGTMGVDILHRGLEKHIKPLSRQQIATARHLGEIQDFEIQRVTGRIRGIKTVICILGETARPQGQIQLIRELKAKGAQVVVILLGYPRHLPYLDAADAIVLAYCDSNKYAETLAAMTNILVGQGPIGFADVRADIEVPVGATRTFDALDIIRVPAGRLPVTLSEKYAVGLAVPTDPQYTLRRVQWDFGDGKKTRDSRASHAYSAPGRYPVSLTVTSRGGETSQCTFTVVAQEVE